MGTLQGKWIFNEDLDLPQGIIEEEVSYDNLVFGSLLLKCWKIKITNSYIDYYVQEHIPPMSYDGNVHTAYDTEKGWYRVGHEIVDFGYGTNVSSELFDWVVSNAKPQDQTVAYKYLFNENIDFGDKFIDERVSFESAILPGVSFERIQIDPTSQTIMAFTKTGCEAVLYKDNWSGDTEEHEKLARMLDFGNREKWVTSDFGNFLRKNTNYCSD